MQVQRAHVAAREPSGPARRLHRARGHLRRHLEEDEHSFRPRPHVLRRPPRASVRGRQGYADPETGRPLKHKMLFGSDYPLITPDRWLADFARLAVKDEVRPLVLKENAARLLGL